MNNSRIVRVCRRYLNLLSELFNTVSLLWVPENCRADELFWAGGLLPKPSSIELDVPLAPIKLALSGFQPICINQLLGLGRDIKSMSVAMLTGHCVKADSRKK